MSIQKAKLEKTHLTKIKLQTRRLLLLGTSDDENTCCEIHGLIVDDDQIKPIPLILVKMLNNIKGFAFRDNNIKLFKEMCDFVNGVFGLLLRNDEESKLFLKAARKIIYAKELGIGITNIEQIISWRTIPSAKAHAWFWFDLIMKIGTVVEPMDISKDYVGDRVRLKKDLPRDHPLVQFVEQHIKPGKMNTAQSVARSIYDSLMDQCGIKKPDKATTKRELQKFIRYKKAREEDPEPYRQQLMIEGFDYDEVMMTTGLNRNMGEINQR